MPRRLTNQAGIELIKTFEGLELEAYQDSVGVYTIGYGHTKGVCKGLTISAAQAELYLKEDLANAEQCVQNKTSAKLTDNQFASLVSFVFNLGCGAYTGSTLRRVLNLGAYSEAAEQFKRWVYAGGKILPGLVRRRKAERELFESA